MISTRGAYKLSATLAASEGKSGTCTWDASFGQAVSPVPRAVQESLAQQVAESAYPAVSGIDELRDSWARYLRTSHNAPFEKSKMLITPGSKFAIHSFFSSIARSVVVLPTPAWVGYEPLASTAGHTVIPLSCSKRQGYKIPLNDLKLLCNAYPEAQIVLIVNSPHNPTGVVYSAKEMEALCKYCETAKVTILFDGIYAASEDFNGIAVATPMHHIPEQTVYLGGASKLFGMGGKRLGFVHVPHAALYHEMRSHISVTVSGVDIGSQKALAAFFSNCSQANEHALLWQSKCATVASYVMSRLSQMNVNPSKSAGAFYIYACFSAHAQHLADKCQVHTSTDLADELMKNVGIRCLPAASFNDDSLAVRLSTQAYDPAMPAVRDCQDVCLDKIVRKHAACIVEGLDKLEKFLSLIAD